MKQKSSQYDEKMDYASDFEHDSEELEDGDGDSDHINNVDEDFDASSPQVGKLDLLSDVNGNIDIATSGNDSDDDSFYSCPEVKLAKLLKINIEADFNVAKINRIKCLALCKIIYGETHWKVAEAHVQLANVYLKGKHYPHQILKHTKIARDMLLTVQKSDSSTEDTEREFLLQNLYYLMGRVNFQLGNYKISENNLMKAKLVSDHTQNSTRRFMNMKINILSSLAAPLSKIDQLGQASEYVEEAIAITDKSASSDKYLAANLYKQIVSIELLNGKHANISFAMEAASKALELSINYNGKESKETADVYILLSRIEIIKEMPDFSKMEHHLQEALRIYATTENNGKMINTQEMICKVLMKQQKFANAKVILKEAISLSEATLGDMSLQSAELYELMGNILFAESKMSPALTYFLKAEETYKAKTRYQKKQVNISKLIDIIRKSQKDDNMKTSELKLKERPRFN